MSLATHMDRYQRTALSALRWLIRRWREFSLFRRNLVVGLVIASGLHLLHGLAPVRATEDLYMDLINRLQVNTVWLNANDGWFFSWKGPRYAFVDIDQRTFEGWGEPFHIPRHHLTEILDATRGSHPRAIVVDVELSRAGPDESADQTLYRYLERYPPNGPPLVLMRAFKPPNGGPAAPDDRAANTLPRWRSSLVGRPVPAGISHNPAIYWAHPNIRVDTGDHVTRRWRLLELGCLDDQPRFVPSAQLLLDILLTDGPEGWREIHARLQRDAGNGCARPADGPPPMPESIRYGDSNLAEGGSARDLNLRPGGIDQRLIFSYSAPWTWPRKELPGGLSSVNVPPGLAWIRAETLLSPAWSARRGELEGRIAVIGASYPDSRDIHPTPVGEMPGALVLINAIKSLHQFGQFNSTRPWFKLPLEVAIIVFLAWAFAHFDELSATLLTGLIVLLLLIPLAWLLFRHATWIELAAPIIGMQLFDLWGDIKEALAHWRRRCHRQPGEEP